MVKSKEMGGDGEVKIMPAQGHCCFTNLHSLKNGVPDWCS